MCGLAGLDLGTAFRGESEGITSATLEVYDRVKSEYPQKNPE